MERRSISEQNPVKAKAHYSARTVLGMVYTGTSRRFCLLYFCKNVGSLIQNIIATLLQHVRLNWWKFT